MLVWDLVNPRLRTADALVGVTGGIADERCIRVV